MATPPGDGGNAPREGFYPDPSIPGYVRYWNGTAWVPGTSRPAPPDAPGVRSAPAPAPAPALDETGPVFLDDDPPGAPQEPASAWQADAARQTGFGGDRDTRVSWGAPAPDPRSPGAPADPRLDVQAPRPALPGRRTGGSGAGGDGEPGDGATPHRPLVPPPSAQPPVDSTVALRALRAARRAKAQGDAAAGRTGPADGTMSIRALSQGACEAGKAAKALPKVPAQPQQLQPAQPTAPQLQPPQPPAPRALPPRPDDQRRAEWAAPEPYAPISAGAGGGATSWAQQVHQLAHDDQAVVGWKPPVEDAFLLAARAQTASRPAGPGKRLVARLIDTLVLGLVIGALAVPLVSRTRTHIDGKIAAAEQTGETVTIWLLDGTTGVYLGVLLAALLIVGVVYEALPTAKWGRTLGKRLCGLDVRDIETHEPPGFGAAVRRWLVYSVLGLLVVGVLNVLWCLFDRPWRQCWHDKAARTFVSG
ncbi:RDD family protein [Streptomyces sp. NPDC087850]|uniref:RDD family protein n=1 Tax=Streptomyces sp. NPDC087850 TaxID=3365809 RepID=UPI0038273C80